MDYDEILETKDHSDKENREITTVSSPMNRSLKNPQAYVHTPEEGVSSCFRPGSTDDSYWEHEKALGTGAMKSDLGEKNEIKKGITFGEPSVRVFSITEGIDEDPQASSSFVQTLSNCDSNGFNAYDEATTLQEDKSLYSRPSFVPNS